MSKGLFIEKDSKPDNRAIKKAVGHARENWTSLTGFLANELKLKGEMKFYGVNYGWAIRFAKSGKSVVALYPDKDGFTAQVILKHAQVKAVIAQGISKSTTDAINRATDFKEGRWVFIRVDHESGTDDVVTLVNARLSIR